MLKSDEIIFVDAERNTGVSKKTGNNYDIGTLIISDSLESVSLDTLPEIAELARSRFKKGDKIIIRVDALRRYNRHQLVVVDVMPVSK